MALRIFHDKYGWHVNNASYEHWFIRYHILEWCNDQFGRETYTLNNSRGQTGWSYNTNTFSFLSHDDLTLFLLRWN